MVLGVLSGKYRKWVSKLGKYSSKWWYAPLLALLSALDAYVLVVPNEPIIAAGVIARPERWKSLCTWMTIGNTLGAVSLAAIVGAQSEWIMEHFVSAKMLDSRTWMRSVHLIDRHGWWGLAVVSLSPFPQHAAVILVGLARMSLWKVFFAILAGRAPKYYGTGWLAAKSPEVLRRWKVI